MQKILRTELYNKRKLADQVEALNLTPEQLAKRAGVSTFSVHAGLAGNLGTLRVLRRLADALKIKWEDLFKLD
jgi:hypothetical protein